MVHFYSNQKERLKGKARMIFTIMKINRNSNKWHHIIHFYSNQTENVKGKARKILQLWKRTKTQINDSIFYTFTVSKKRETWIPMSSVELK